MKLFFRNYGNKGDAQIIILHGLFGLSDNWVTYAKQVAALGFEVFVVDQRNHGKSPSSMLFNYTVLADDLMNFIIENDIHNPIIMGHSLGGKVAMLFALKNPKFTNKLIIVDIAPKKYQFPDVLMQIINAITSINIGNASSRAEIEILLLKKITDKSILNLILKNVYRNGKNSFGWYVNIDSIKKNISNIAEGINTHSKFEKPTLFVIGGKSDYVLLNDFKEIKNTFTNVDFKTISNALHWVHADCPIDFFKVTTYFLLDSV